MQQAGSCFGRAVAAAAALVLAAGLPALAQKITFEPSIELGQGHTDNVGFDTADPRSDEVTTLRAVLPLLREWRTGRLDLRYEPAFSRYAETGSLDRDEHKLRFGIRAEPQRGTTYALTTRVRVTQLQGDPESSDSEDLFISRRTDRRIASADFTTETRLGQRWSWELGLGGALHDFSAIDGFGDTSPDNAVEDRTEARSSVRLSRQLRQASLGVQVVYSEFDLDVSPDAEMSSARLVYTRSVGRHSNLRLALGAYDLDSELSTQDKTGVDLNASVSRRFRNAQLALSAQNSPSSGGALRGASTNSVLGLSLSSLRLANWNWRVSPRFAERDPNDRSLGVRTTLAVGGEVGRQLSPKFWLRLRANHIKQTNDAPGTEDRDNLTAELALLWFPRGRG